MNECKRLLLCGRGSCYSMIKKNPQKYFNVLSWACRHGVSYHPQGEGSKADFVYNLFSFYEDNDKFLDEIIKHLSKNEKNHDVYSYQLELLYLFARDGYIKAKNQLESVYKKLFKKLLFRKNDQLDSYNYCLDNFISICNLLGGDKVRFSQIAENLAMLYIAPNGVQPSDMKWIYEFRGKEHLTYLNKKAEKKILLQLYLKISQIEEQKEMPPYEENEEDKDAKCYRDYLLEEDLTKRANKLRYFIAHNFPEDISILLEDYNKGNELLKDVVISVLTEIDDERITNWANEQLEKDFERILPLWIRHYKKEQEDLLFSYLKRVPVDFASEHSWHECFSEVLFLEEKSTGLIPIEILLYIYDKEYCSYCRLRVLSLLKKRKKLTKEIIQECRLDASIDIREFVSHYKK